MMTTNTLNKRAAKAAGYSALTDRYYLPEEQEMLDCVVADMRRGKIGHVLVKDRLGVSVWRKGRNGLAVGDPKSTRKPKCQSLVTSAATRRRRAVA